MENKSIWDWLGIAPTTDEAMIKKAYAAQAKLYHPEEKPEEFQQLRKAYKRAMQQKKRAHIIISDDLFRVEKPEATQRIIRIDSEEREREKEKEVSDNLQDDVQENLEQQYNYDIVYEKVNNDRYERFEKDFLPKVGRLANNLRQRNDLNCWKQLMESNNDLDIKDSKYLKMIIKALLWRTGLKTEIYQYIYNLSSQISGDTELELLKDKLKRKYEIEIKQQYYTDTKNDKEDIHKVMQKIKDLCMNGVGKDNINLWKDILEESGCKGFYTSELFIEIIDYVLSIGNLKADILCYIYNMSMQVFEKSSSFIEIQSKLMDQIGVQRQKEQIYKNHIAYVKKIDEKNKKVNKKISNVLDGFGWAVGIAIYIVIFIFTHGNALNDSNDTSKNEKIHNSYYENSTQSIYIDQDMKQRLEYESESIKNWLDNNAKQYYKSRNNNIKNSELDDENESESTSEAIGEQSASGD